MHWAPSPEILSFGPLALRWYGMLFAAGFILAYVYLSKIFPKEGRPKGELDELLIYIVVGTVVGARLGHCLFYEPMRYLENPLEILFIWHGGLASHGAAIGIIVACWLFSRRPGTRSFLWITDRVCLTVPMAGASIRLGNFFNSEIIGKQTDVPWAVIFERVDSVPRHPSQLYEALIYIIIFLVNHMIYRRQREKTPEGLIFGSLFIMLFTARILIEFTKENQVDFESSLPLNMGQLLSIPAVLFGVWMVRYSLKNRQTSKMKRVK